MAESTAPAGRVAVVGAGTMGAGLAQICATAGREVVLYSRTLATLDRAQAAIDWSLRRLAKRAAAEPSGASGSAAALDPGTVRSLITATTDLDDLAGSAVVVESVVEDLDVKQRLLARLADLCPDGALLASNTSALPISAIAAAVPRPERVVGMHFFSPVPLMRLCEITRGELTSDGTVVAARAFAAEIGKTSIVVERDSPGFVTTRLMTVLILEAVRMVERGLCTPSDLDLACQLAFGHPMGPLASADLSGLDVVRNVAAHLHEVTGDAMFAPPALLDELVVSGRHGVKSGAGFHSYAERSSGAERTQPGEPAGERETARAAS